MSDNNIAVPTWLIGVSIAIILALIGCAYYLGHKEYTTENLEEIAKVRTECDQQIRELEDERDKQIHHLEDERNQMIADIRTECSKEKADIRAECSKEIADIRAECSKEIADIRAEYEAIIRKLIINGEIIASTLKELLLTMPPTTSASEDSTSYIDSIINPFLYYMNKLDSTTKKNIKIHTPR